ncbi:MAG: 2-oxo acid dehydrogenase subunit E2 [Chloroflexi bacterium]|nr:2-oxo acid dehydrogenase subunit E2 [Chloroflexota bacterium]
MAVEITMPKLGLTMEEGSVTQWLKEEGQPVKKGEPLLDTTLTKAAVEIESPADGTLSFVRPAIGETLPIGTLLAYLLQPGEAAPKVGLAPAAPAAAPVSAGTVEVQAVAPERSREDGGRLFSSPAARRVAGELGVDIRLVPGTGPNGRIQEDDVRAFAERQKTEKLLATPLAAKVAADRGIDLSEVAAAGRRITLADVEKAAEAGVAELVPSIAAIPRGAPAEEEIVALTRLRKTIGERMLQSVTTAPHFNISVEIDMSEAARLREKLLDMVKAATGNRLSYTAILVKVVAQALARHPMVNASFDNGQIRLHKEVNVGVAVAVEPGLLVPVIRSADKKNLIEISRALKDLQDKSRDLKFKPDELTGGTFTISNLGMFGIDEFTPIINPPESAILGLGQIADRPVAKDGQVVIRPIMKATLSVDHRVLDGATAAPFLSDIKRTLENPYLLL